MPLALVTGATGFVGGAVLRELLAKGWSVRVLYRPDSHPHNLEGHGPELQRRVGDLRDPASLQAALEGCDYLFHVAARYQFGLFYSRDLYLDNVVGTRNILAAAGRCGVKKVVYTSTVGVLHGRADGVPVDETRLAESGELAGPYKRSKWLAEQEVAKAVAEGLPVVTVCPTAPVGPCDVKPTPTGQMVLDYLLGRMTAYIETGLNLVAVEDVAAGHILAADNGRVGRRYILGCENLSLKQIFETLSKISGVPAPRRRLPKRILLPVAYLSEALSTITRRPPRLSLEHARMSQVYMYFDSSRAIDELGFSAGSVEEALERAVRWFEDHGYLDGKGKKRAGSRPPFTAAARGESERPVG